MKKWKRIFIIALLCIISFSSFFGWNVLKDMEETIIQVSKVSNAKIVAINDKVSNGITLEGELSLGKFKQFDHLYFMQEKEELYISLSETISFNLNEIQKFSVSLSNMELDEKYEIKRVYLTSGPKIFSQGVDPRRYKERQLIWLRDGVKE